MTPEKKVQNSIINYLNELTKEGLPILVQRRQAGGFNYKKGIPDIYVVINGIHLEVEIKKPGGQLGALQEKWRDKCKKLNILWYCADSLSDFKEYFNSLLKNIL